MLSRSDVDESMVKDLGILINYQGNDNIDENFFKHKPKGQRDNEDEGNDLKDSLIIDFNLNDNYYNQNWWLSMQHTLSLIWLNCNLILSTFNPLSS